MPVFAACQTGERPGELPARVGAHHRVNLGAKSFGSASFGFCGFFFPISRRGVGFERPEKVDGHIGDFIDSGQEGGFVGLGRFVESRDFSNKLKGSGADLFGGDGWVEIEEGFYVSAHDKAPSRILAE
jgi:hypothetical protein